jgi:hypothetical protein
VKLPQASSLPAGVWYKLKLVVWFGIQDAAVALLATAAWAGMN